MFHGIDNYMGGGEGRGRELVHISAMRRKVHRVDSDQYASYQSQQLSSAPSSAYVLRKLILQTVWTQIRLLP